MSITAQEEVQVWGQCALHYLAEGRGREVLPRAPRIPAQQLQLHPSPGQGAARDGHRAGPVACRSHGCYSGSVAGAGSYGGRVEVMCPDHIIGVDKIPSPISYARSFGLYGNLILYVFFWFMS